MHEIYVINEKLVRKQLYLLVKTADRNRIPGHVTKRQVKLFGTSNNISAMCKMLALQLGPVFGFVKVGLNFC